MAQALREITSPRQLALYGRGPSRPRPVARVGATHPRLCAGCRAREARYGFRDDAHPQMDRPQTLCFGRTRRSERNFARAGASVHGVLPAHLQEVHAVCERALLHVRSHS